MELRQSSNEPLSDRSDNERKAQIFRYWKAIELFSPQKVPDLKPNGSKPTVRVGSDTPLNWLLPWLPSPDKGKVWRYKAFCGIYNFKAVRELLEERFGADENSFDQRPDGQSCLFFVQITKDGRPMLESFTLASTPWAAAQLLKMQAHEAFRLEGFEAASEEQGLRFAERFAVRENDEVGHDLLSKGVNVGRPIRDGELEAEVDMIAKSIGVQERLKPEQIRLTCEQIDERADASQSDGFLNSFFLKDLERLADESNNNNLSAPLNRFLTGESKLTVSERIDLRKRSDVLRAKTSPLLVPQGHWPSMVEQSLYFSQQLALNIALDQFANTSEMLFSINGPPGTGKTTLLRDIFSNVIVERAKALAKLSSPQSAFRGNGTWEIDKLPRTIWRWQKDLLGFEIVVTSSNNRAVENVSLEVPNAKAVGDRWLANVDYFADFGTRLLERKGEENQEAWALFCARLGSKENRHKFINAFWFPDEAKPEPRSRSQEGFLAYLNELKTRKAPPPQNWQSAVVRFNEALICEREMRLRRADAWVALGKRTEVQALKSKLETELSDLAAPLEQIEQESRMYLEEEERVRCDFDSAVAARRQNYNHKPGFLDVLITLGAAYREWRPVDMKLAEAIEIKRSSVEAAAAKTLCLNLRDKELRRKVEEVARSLVRRSAYLILR